MCLLLALTIGWLATSTTASANTASTANSTSNDRITTHSLSGRPASEADEPASTGNESDDDSKLERPSAAVLAPYGGQWRRRSDEGLESSRILSIETATRELNWIVRRMAAGVLEKSTVPPLEMKFSWDGERLHQEVDGDNGRFLRPVDFDGPPQRQTDERGDPFTSTWVWTPDGLQVNWTQEQAFGSNLYRLDERGQSLVIEHRINVTAISGVAPIVYESRFSRAALPRVAAGGTDGTAARPESSASR